jgi:gliding motility-associated-like protein
MLIIKKTKRMKSFYSSFLIALFIFFGIVDVSADAPTAINDTVQTDEDVSIIIPVVDNNDVDADNDMVSIDTMGLLGALHGRVVIDRDSVIYTSDLNYNGQDSFQYQVIDAASNTDTAWVFITINDINDKPIAENWAITIDEDMPFVVPTAELNKYDVDGVIDSINVLTSFGLLEGTVNINSDSIVYTPNPNYFGGDIMQYTVTDDDGAIDTAWVMIVINDVNDPPIALDDIVSTNEDKPIVISVVKNDNDVDGSIVLIDTTGLPSSLKGSLIINSNKITYNPDINYFGEDSLQYFITDDDGASDTAWVLITVNDVNDNPVAVNDTATTDEDKSVVIPDVDNNDADIDGTLVSIATAGLIPPSHGSVLIDNDSLIYTPTKNFFGVDSFQYATVDNDGGKGIAWVFIMVNDINDKPVAVNDTTMTDEDVSVIIPVADNNDSDSDGSIDSIATIGLISPSHGSVLINNDSLIYTPPKDFFGKDSLQYSIIDDDGAKDTAWVFITINEVNDAPFAIDDVASTDEDVALIIPIVDNNDMDIDGSIDSVSLTGLLEVKHGMALLVGDSLKYTPDENFFGKDSLQYSIIDDDGAKAIAWIFIIINDVNDAPTAINDTVTTDEDVVILVPVVTNNDSDVDGSILSLHTTGVIAALHGSVAVVGQDLQYTPDKDFAGEDSLQYEIIDNDGGKAIAWLMVIINPMEDNPIANDNSLITDFVYNQEVIIPNIIANDSDLDGDIDSSSVLFINPETGVLVSELSMAGEGTWTYNILSLDVIFTPDTACYIEPNPVQYILYDKNGHISLPATLRIAYVRYDFYYDGNGADSHVPTYFWNDIEGYRVTIDEMIPRFEGYMFRGWEMLTNGVSNTFQPNDVFVLPPRDITLVAIWEEIVVEEAFMANVFTPNGDGIHDTYVIPWAEEISEPIHFSVFNQWGDLVYEHASYDNSWDGAPNRGVVVGNELPVGTYYYRIEIKGAQVTARQGYIYLKR